MTDAYDAIVEHLTAGERWIVLRQEPVSRAKRQHKVWVIADPREDARRRR